MEKFNCFVIINLIFAFGLLQAKPYDDMIAAIKQSDLGQIQEISESTAFTAREKIYFLTQATEVLAFHKVALENREQRVWASLAFKVFGGLLGSIPGFYLDQRGLAALLAIPTTIASVTPLVVLIIALDEARMKSPSISIPSIATVMSMSALAAGATYGLIRLEKYFWQHEAQIKLECQTAYDKASNCKIFIEKLLN